MPRPTHGTVNAVDGRLDPLVLEAEQEQSRQHANSRFRGAHDNDGLRTLSRYDRLWR
jgi:hypothetical protein